jgi:hypothetical protein
MAERLQPVQSLLNEIQEAKSRRTSPGIVWLERAVYGRLLDLRDVVQFLLPRPHEEPKLELGPIYYAGYHRDANMVVLTTPALDDWETTRLDVVLGVPREEAEDLFAACTACFVVVRMTNRQEVQATLTVHKGKLPDLSDWRESQKLPPNALAAIIGAVT